MSIHLCSCSENRRNSYDRANYTRFIAEFLDICRLPHKVDTSIQMFECFIIKQGPVKPWIWENRCELNMKINPQPFSNTLVTNLGIMCNGKGCLSSQPCSQIIFF